MKSLLRFFFLLTVPVVMATQKASWKFQAKPDKFPDVFQDVRVEQSDIEIKFNRQAIDFASQTDIAVTADQISGVALCSGGDAATPLVFRKQGEAFVATLPQDESCYGVKLTHEGLANVTLIYTPSNALKPINLAPAINPPQGKAQAVKQVCQQQGNVIVVDTGRLKATFDTANGLRLTELFSADLNRQILRYPQQTELFRLKLDNGTVLDCSAAIIQALKVMDDGFIATLSCPEGITAKLKCAQQDRAIALTLSLSAEKEIAVKTAFPQIDGLSLSAEEQDYYCFPWGGGVIGDRPAYLRSIYGENDAWWQLLDLFSPENGGGLFLHVQDATGVEKAFSMRKGHTPASESIIRPPNVAARNDLSLYFYQFHMPDGHGSAMAVDYQRTTLKPGQDPRDFPMTVIGSHAGNWKSPMKIYAKWAKSVWQFRPYPGKLSTKFNYVAGFGCEGNLYTAPSWETEAFVPKNDICEVNGWWSVSPLAPWNTKWEDFAQLGPRAEKSLEKNFGYGHDPITNEPFYVFNRVDYDGYNPQWGGLPRFQKLIQDIRDHKKLSILYTDPIIVCGNSKYGQTEAAKHAVINPVWKDPHQCPRNPTSPEGVVCNYYAYCMCLNDADYLPKVAADIGRIARETGADGVRLDEYGHRGYVCLSKTHRHIFGEYGQHVWQQALERSLQMIREEVPADTLLITEFPEADFCVAHLDGALSYDICRHQSPLRPLQVNLFRFYFPECRLFELNVGGPQNAKDIMFFNGVGVYNSGGRYSEEYSKILHENAECFIGEIEPLVATLKPFVYANRFAAQDGSKVLFTLYNGTDRDFSGAVLTIPDGYECQQLLPTTNHTAVNGKNVHIALVREQIGVILMRQTTK